MLVEAQRRLVTVIPIQASALVAVLLRSRRLTMLLDLLLELVDEVVLEDDLVLRPPQHARHASLNLIEDLVGVTWPRYIGIVVDRRKLGFICSTERATLLHIHGRIG